MQGVAPHYLQVILILSTKHITEPTEQGGGDKQCLRKSSPQLASALICLLGCPNMVHWMSPCILIDVCSDLQHVLLLNGKSPAMYGFLQHRYLQLTGLTGSVVLARFHDSGLNRSLLLDAVLQLHPLGLILFAASWWDMSMTS